MRKLTPSENIVPSKKKLFWWMAGILFFGLPVACLMILIVIFSLQRNGIIPSAPELNGDLPARDGEIALSTGFTPDPYMVPVSSGGQYDVSALINGVNCRGYVNQEPSFRLHLSGTADELNIIYASDTGNTTLIIRDPNGNWFCNKYYVADTTAALIYFPSSIEGQYDIWVANSEQDVVGRGNLFISSQNFDIVTLPATPTPFRTSTPVKVVALDPSIAANNQPKIYLAGLFDPDPTRYQFPLQQGGNVNISDSFYDPYCVGYATLAPDYVVYWSGGAPYLSFFFVESNSYDTTLVIQDPVGIWYCNDNSNDGINPMASMASTPGEYKIWIGRKTPNTSISGIFYATHGHCLDTRKLSEQGIHRRWYSGNIFITHSWNNAIRG
jgi:hypothetical protein